MDDDLLFYHEDDQTTDSHSSENWRVLIVDDEEDVHTVTRFVLSSVVFEGKTIEFISAYSGSEALDVLKNNRDIAVILLDVVMETDDAGLRLVKVIREDLNNKDLRIILRTGQPGDAPEKEVIDNYDINDYKEKTELTRQKLYTAVLSALRSYRELKLVESYRDGLKYILESSLDIYSFHRIFTFSEKVLNHLADLAYKHHEGDVSSLAVRYEGQNGIFLTGSGEFPGEAYLPLNQIISSEDLMFLDKVKAAKKSCFEGNRTGVYIQTENEMEHIFFLKSQEPISELGMELVDIFTSNVVVGLDNIYLNNEILDTQKEIIYTLGEVVETRNSETGDHVKRVGAFSYLMAVEFGLSLEEAELLKIASPMHDIGKIGIPESILQKPGKLTAEEFEHMKAHTRIGYDILKGSERSILKAASVVALEHHEKWDGSGYPMGKKGEGIHIYARITAVADVFDALYHKRAYKEPWPVDKILELMNSERDKHFDGRLVDIVQNNIEKFIDICNKFSS